MISGIPYDYPLHTNPVDIPNGASQHESIRLTLTHAEAIRVFRDTVELEKVLVSITCNAVQDTYYKERINPHTSTVTEEIPVFLP